MHEIYGIPPVSINPERVDHFLRETELSTSYRQHISDWFFKHKREQLKSCPTNSCFSNVEMQTLQPYVQLFTDYLGRYHDIKQGQDLSAVTDLISPEEWFPDARSMRRRIIYHMGPTNSGKTRNAFEALVESKNGIYLAPLRLLAWEIAETLQSRGKVCNLFTGQEQKI